MNRIRGCAALVAVLCVACGEAIEPGAVFPPIAELTLPGARVGPRHPTRPDALDESRSRPADLRCLGEPLVLTGGAATLMVLAEDSLSRLTVAGVCVRLHEGARLPDEACGADDARTGPTGLATVAIDGPGRWTLELSSEREASATYPGATVMVTTVTDTAWGGRIAILELPLDSVAMRRLIALALGLGPELRGADTVFVRVFAVDCAGSPVAGLKIEWLSPEGWRSARYADGAGLPILERSFTHRDGVAYFPEVPAARASTIWIRALGRRTDDGPIERLACAQAPVRAYAESRIVLVPSDARDARCEDGP